MTSPCAIMIFARAPVSGLCKTRLIPALGAEGAARLHAMLVEHALRTAIASKAGEVTLWCADDPAHPFFARCAAAYGVRLCEQGSGDLGERMHKAFCGIYGPALLMGSDAPSITAQDIAHCAAQLANYDAVFLPAEDGGYALAGLRQPCEALFRDMVWSTPRVMEETRARLRASGLSWSEPRVVWDVDEPRDLERFDSSFYPA